MNHAETSAAAVATAPTDPKSLNDALTLGKKLAPDATLLLMQDHAEAMAYFDWAEGETGRTRSMVVGKLCTALTVHMAVEEEILYPAAIDALGETDDSLIEHAYAEHNEAKEIIKQLSASKAPKAGVPATLKKLRAAIEHHVAEEHEKLFPRLRDSGVELYAIGCELAARRAELLSQLTGRSSPPSALKDEPSA
jgi:hypothetical protein